MRGAFSRAVAAASGRLLQTLPARNAISSQTRPVVFLHPHLGGDANYSKNIVQLPLKSLKDFEQHKDERDWVFITHGGIPENGGETEIDYADSDASIGTLLTKIPENSTVYLSFCYQLSDEQWQELSRKNPSLKIIAFGNVAKPNQVRVIVGVSSLLTSKEVLEEYSFPFNLIRVFKAGTKLEEIKPEAYLKTPDDLTIDGCKIKVDPVLLGNKILEQDPKRIFEFFERFSKYFLPSDMAKINEVLSLRRPQAFKELLKAFFANADNKEILKEISSIIQKNPEKEHDFRQPFANSILKSFGINSKGSFPTLEEIQRIECFPGATQSKPAASVTGQEAQKSQKDHAGRDGH